MKLHGAALSAVPLSAKLVQRSRPLENGTLGQTACGLLQRTNRRGRVHQVDPSFLFFFQVNPCAIQISAIAILRSWVRLLAAPNTPPI